MTTENIKEVIQNKINDLVYENIKPRMSEDYYKKLDAKIEVLDEILRMIED